MQCEARFLDEGQRLTGADEYAHYLHHENGIDDSGYRNFLNKLAEPLLAKLKPSSTGLDYGCGPGPALAAMISEAGHEMRLFDPFFHNDEHVLSGSYDFVTCTETAEHFHHPAREFRRLYSLLRPGGWLAVMTCFQTSDEAFSQWHYRRDPTHVVFYRDTTFLWLADHLGFSCEFPVKDVVLMQKNR